VCGCHIRDGCYCQPRANYCPYKYGTEHGTAARGGARTRTLAGGRHRRPDRRAAVRRHHVDADADAIVGASFDYEEMAEGMLWVNVAGTAVQTRRA
jgi:uncharacterized protein YbjQ (UPF0145 family)